MKNGNKRQLFSLRTVSPVLCESSLSRASFSWVLAWISSPPGKATLIGQADLSSLALQRMSVPLRRRVQSECNLLDHSRFTIIVLLFFMAPEKKQHRGGPQPRSWSWVTGMACTNSSRHTTKPYLRQNAFLDLLVAMWLSPVSLDGKCVQCTLTLANEGLAGVQQNITALNNHSFNGQIFPYVFSVAHLVMHYSVEERQTQRYCFYCLWSSQAKKIFFVESWIQFVSNFLWG